MPVESDITSLYFFHNFALVVSTSTHFCYDDIIRWNDSKSNFNRSVMLTRRCDPNNDHKQINETVDISNQLVKLTLKQSFKLMCRQRFVNYQLQLSCTLKSCLLPRKEQKLQGLPIKMRAAVEESIRLLRFIHLHSGMEQLCLLLIGVIIQTLNVQYNEYSYSTIQFPACCCLLPAACLLCVCVIPCWVLPWDICDITL